MSLQPAVRANNHMISAGHHLAAEAGHRILLSGGNAFDAGVAAGIALGVVQPDMVQVSGVAPIILYHAETDEVVTVSGLGWWPRAATLDLFLDKHEGTIPTGILRTIIPAAPDAWIRVLERWGTMRFGDVAEDSVRWARDGFAIHDLLAENIETHGEAYQRWPETAAVYFPDGKPLGTGDRITQTNLAGTLQYMIDEERAVAGREAGLQAARNAFYRGDIARTITHYHAQNDGLLTMEDFAGYESAFEPAVHRRFSGFGEPIDVYSCGPWCQGPVLVEMLAILEGIDIVGLGHNSVDYVHCLTEAMKLAFADREAHYGDPRFIPVPIAELVSEIYGARRRREIDPKTAHPGMPQPGIPAAALGDSPIPDPAAPLRQLPLDTSYVCVVDSGGNVFSATPSDVTHQSPMIPGLGMCPSSRGSQSWAVPGHPSAVAPGKRPRLTPSPALAMRDGFALPFGTPGGDVQPQAMLQAFLNMESWGMAPQDAVEAPRFATFSFPGSFEPHIYEADVLRIEEGIGGTVRDDLLARGHKVEIWAERSWKAGTVCTIAADRKTGVMTGAADPRRSTRALGW